METSERLSVAYSTDENYVKLTCVSIASLLTHNPGAHVILLANKVSSASLDFIRALCTRLGGTFEAIDVQARLADLERRGANGYTSYSIYARLFIPELTRCPRVIYLDCDTLVTGSLAPLLKLNLHEKPFAIGYDCQRIEYKKMIGLPPDVPYFNSGVMVIDCMAWRKSNITNRLLAAATSLPERSIFPDQDLMIRTLDHEYEIALLPPAYNFLSHYQMFKTRNDVLTIMAIPEKVWYSAEAYAAARKAPVVHHFAGHTLGRPWHRESKNPIRGTYREFAALAGVPEVAEQSRPLDFGYRVQYLCWKLLPNALFIQACRAMYRYFFWRNYGV